MSQNDTLYIAIHDSPRSRILPESKGWSRVKLSHSVTIWQSLSLQQYRNVRNDLKAINSRYENVFIEYDGNPILNLLIRVALFRKKCFGTLVLDCHNAAVEKEKGKFLKYYVNLFYIKMFGLMNGKIIVHNSFLQKKVKDSSLLYTPYPDLRPADPSKAKTIDILFITSFNSDEPIKEFIGVAKHFSSLGWRIKITGNYKKASDSLRAEGRDFFTGFLDYEEYLECVRDSKLCVAMTTRDETLLFSPRECIVIGVSILINDSMVNREFYEDRATYSTINVDQMIKAILN